MSTARYLSVCVELPRGSNIVVINDEEASVNGEDYFLFEIVNFDEPLRTEVLTAMIRSGSDKARKSLEFINRPKTDYDSPEYISSMPESDLKIERQKEAIDKEIVNKFPNDPRRQRRARNFRDYIKLNDIPQVLSDIGNSSEAVEDAVFVLNKLHDYGLINDWRFNYVSSKITPTVSDIIPFSQISAKVLRLIANERYDASSAKTKQDLINGLSLVGYKDGIPAATVKSAERKSRWN